MCSGRSHSQDLERISDLAAQLFNLKAAQASALAKVSDLEAAQVSATAKVSDLEAAQVSATAKVSAVTSEVAALKVKVATDASSPTSKVEWVQNHVRTDRREWQLMVNLEKIVEQDTTINSTRLSSFFELQAPHKQKKNPNRKGEKPSRDEMPPPENPAGEKNWVQPLWSNKWGPALNATKGLKLYVVDSHKKYNALPKLRPDGALYPVGYPKTHCNVVMIFESKGYSPNNQNFSHEAIAQLLNGLRVLIDVQRRSDYSKGGFGMAIGYLNDGVNIQFFELTEHKTRDQPYCSQQTRVMPLNGIGGEILIKLLAIDDLASLGFCPPTIFYNRKKLKLLELLGKGSFARVYRCCEEKTHAKIHVVKLFYPDKTVETEAENLRVVNSKFDKHFADVQPPNFMFTRLIGTCTDAKGNHNALLLSPEGKPFVRDVLQIRAAHLKMLCAEDLFEQNHLIASCQIFCALIDALQFLHVECCLVHRDVKLSNFFLVKVSSSLSVDNTTVHPPVDAVVITNPLSLFTYHSDQKEIQNPSQRSGQRGESRLACRYCVQ